jgi:hypothetical protein
MGSTRWLVSIALAASAVAMAGGHASGGGAGHSSGGASARSGAVGAGDRAGGVSSGALSATAVTHTVIAGEQATVAHLPAHEPFNEAERRTLRHVGYHALTQDQVTYWCRRLRWTGQAWVKDCFE